VTGHYLLIDAVVSHCI